MRNNPYAPDVPCHRVVASDGTIGGFKGKTAGKTIQEKIALLRSEGVRYCHLKEKSKILLPHCTHFRNLARPLFL